MGLYFQPLRPVSCSCMQACLSRHPLQHSLQPTTPPQYGAASETEGEMQQKQASLKGGYGSSLAGCEAKETFYLSGWARYYLACPREPPACTDGKPDCCFGKGLSQPFDEIMESLIALE